MKRPATVEEQEAVWDEVIERVKRLDQQAARDQDAADDEFDDQPTPERRQA